MDLAEERGDDWSSKRRPVFRIVDCIFPIGANERERKKGLSSFFLLFALSLLGISGAN